MIFVKELKAELFPALLSAINLKTFLHSASYLETYKLTRQTPQFYSITYHAPWDWNMLTRTKRNHTDVHEDGLLKRMSEANKKQVSNIFITKIYVLRLSA